MGSPDAPSEKAKGWLKGPFTRVQLDARYGSPLWVPSLRFGTDKQLDKEGRPKIRAIDDLSAMFHNACVTCDEKISTCGVDGIAAIAKLWSDLVVMARRNSRWAMSVVLSTGERLSGVLHKIYRDGGVELAPDAPASE